MEATLIILGRSGVVQVAFACGINNAAVPRTSKKKHCLIKFIVGNDGQTYLSGLPQQGHLYVSWGQGANEHCVADYALTDEKEKTSIINAAAQCH